MARLRWRHKAAIRRLDEECSNGEKDWAYIPLNEERAGKVRRARGKDSPHSQSTVTRLSVGHAVHVMGLSCTDSYLNPPPGINTFVEKKVPARLLGYKSENSPLRSAHCLRWSVIKRSSKILHFGGALALRPWPQNSQQIVMSRFCFDSSFQANADLFQDGLKILFPDRGLLSLTCQTLIVISEKAAQPELESITSSLLFQNFSSLAWIWINPCRGPMTRGIGGLGAPASCLLNSAWPGVGFPPTPDSSCFGGHGIHSIVF